MIIYSSIEFRFFGCLKILLINSVYHGCSLEIINFKIYWGLSLRFFGIILVSHWNANFIKIRQKFIWYNRFVHLFLIYNICTLNMIVYFKFLFNYMTFTIHPNSRFSVLIIAAYRVIMRTFWFNTCLWPYSSILIPCGKSIYSCWTYISWLIQSLTNLYWVVIINSSSCCLRLSIAHFTCFIMIKFESSNNTFFNRFWHYWIFFCIKCSLFSLLILFIFYLII